jgi:hypothetical protein
VAVGINYDDLCARNCRNAIWKLLPPSQNLNWIGGGNVLPIAHARGLVPASGGGIVNRAGWENPKSGLRQRQRRGEVFG